MATAGFLLSLDRKKEPRLLSGMTNHIFVIKAGTARKLLISMGLTVANFVYRLYANKCSYRYILPIGRRFLPIPKKDREKHYSSSL
jgi:hypothetical protein